MVTWLSCLTWAREGGEDVACRRPPHWLAQPPATEGAAVFTALPSLKRQWLPKSKMAPLGIDETIDKLKMMEGRNSSIRKAVRIAFDRAMNHLSRVHGEPASDLSDID